MNKFKLGSWKVEPNKSLLTSDSGKEVRIEPLNMALLCYFAQNPGEPINREKLIEDVWHNKIVTDHAVYKTINQLRKYLASDGDSQDYLKTIPKKGYSLVATLEEIIEASPKEAVSLRIEASSENRLKKWFYRHPVINTLSIILVIGLLLWNLGLNTWWYKVQQPLYSNISVINQIEGILDEAVPSPDGNWLAVTSFGDSNINNRDIYLLNLETQQKYRLTKGEYDYSEISWSSSGKKLITSRRPNSGVTNEICDLVILDLSSNLQSVSSQKEITKCSPLGSSAAYDDQKGIIYYNYTKSTVVPSSIYSFELNSGEIELLTNPGSAVWGDWSVRMSPDGTKLLYMRVYEEDNEVFIYDLESKEEELVFTYISYVDQLSWTPDSKGIIYQPNKNQVALYSIEYKFSKVLMTKDNAIVSSYSSQISDDIYTVSRNNDAEIIAFFKSDPSTRKIVNSSKAMEIAAVYANLSDDYVFVSKRSGNWQLWLNKNGSIAKLTDNKTDSVIYTPKWSADDKQITYSMGGGIYAINIASKKTEEIYREEGVYSQIPFWAPNSESIYFTKPVQDINQIFNIDVASKKLKQVTSNGGYAGAVTLDSNAIFLVKDDHHGLWRLDLRNLEEVKVNDIANIDDFELIHAVQNGIYFSHNRNREKNLYFVNSSTLETTRVLTIEDSNLNPFSINHTGERILTIVNKFSNANLSVYRP